MYGTIGLDVGEEIFHGPDGDHTPTSDSGSFAVVDLSSLSVGNLVRFTTCAMPPSSDVCTLRFWYFISGLFLTFFSGNRKIIYTS